jgi:hypothetical protein
MSMLSAAFEHPLKRINIWAIRLGKIGLAGCIFAAGQLHAQGAGIRPGCWDVRVRVDTIAIQSAQTVQTIDAQKVPSLDEMMQQTLSRLTPDQRAHINEAQLRQEIAASLDAERKAIEKEKELVRKPVVGHRVSNGVRCSLHPLADMRIPAADVRSTDADHFNATQRQTAANGTVTVTTVGKWISEAAAHMPYSPAPTDLDGHTAKGPHAVMWLDQNRIVAVIDGQRITALVAYLVLHLAPGHMDDAGVDKHSWASVLQHEYMYWSVSNGAGPKTPAQKAQGILRVLGTFSASNTGSDEGDSVDTRVYDYHYLGNDSQEYVREQHLWDAYLSRATSASGRQALAQQAQDQYRITVVDPDFFAGQPGT